MNKDLLKHVRQIAGFTQRELAGKVGVHHSLICKIEKGVIPVQPVTEQKIYKAFSEAGISEQEIASLYLFLEGRK
ncbi:helix-turn-helix domain-containing protein [Mesobacillus foraminis]|uniref:helix-turn-helix domain-containing protein n=1 Tax=Mesobacillus foraminis TaxID=279826 RepID=UPI0039A36C2F